MWSQPEEDRPMLRTLLGTLLAASTMVCAILLPLAGHAAQLDELISPNLELPSSDTMFPAGPGADAMNGNCLACHSADHMLNQPTLPRKAWQEVVDKMINAYKAPITPQDAATIVDYLARTKGTT
jgi:mono/diheme cytochrome c family protein